MPSAIVYCVEQMSIETKKELHGILVDQQKGIWIQALKDKRNHIDNAKEVCSTRRYIMVG